MTTTTPRKRAVRRPAGTAKPRAVTEVADVAAEIVADAPVEGVASESDAGGPAVEVVDEGAEATAEEASELDTEVQRAKYVAKRKLTFKGKVYQPGEPVPGAEQIQRIETWVVHGYLKEA